MIKSEVIRTNKIEDIFIQGNIVECSDGDIIFITTSMNSPTGCFAGVRIGSRDLTNVLAYYSVGWSKHNFKLFSGSVKLTQ